MVHIKGVQREDLLKIITRKMAPPLGSSAAVWCSAKQETRQSLPLSHSHLITTRGAVGRASEYQPPSPTTPRYPCQRNACLLLQIQRPAICQGGEAGYHGPARERQECRYVARRIEGVSENLTCRADRADSSGMRPRWMSTLCARQFGRWGRWRSRSSRRRSGVWAS